MTLEQALLVAVGALSSSVVYMSKLFIGYLIKDNTVWRTEMKYLLEGFNKTLNEEQDKRRAEHSELLNAIRTSKRTQSEDA